VLDRAVGGGVRTGALRTGQLGSKRRTRLLEEKSFTLQLPTGADQAATREGGAQRSQRVQVQAYQGKPTLFVFSSSLKIFIFGL